METQASDSSASQTVRVDRANLVQLVVKLLQRKGMFAAEAELVASRLIEADHAGRFADGVGSLPQYLEAMDLGDIDPRARIITVSDGPATALLDGSTGIGHVAVTRAMLLAIEKARAVGTGIVVVKNSRACGDAGVIARLAADAGLIGFVLSSFAERMADGTERRARAWGLPASGGSTSLVIRDNEWDHGEASSLVAGVLTAGLAGGETLPRKRKAARVANLVEHFVQVIDPDKFSSRDVLVSKWGPTLTARASQSTSGSNVTAEAATVVLQSEDARALAELSKSIKFDVTW